MKKKLSRTAKLVSIIIRAKNEKKYILQSIKKILSQSYKKIEIIIIDNNSTDGTLKLLESLNIKNLVIKQYPFKNYKPGKSLNYGVSYSRGEFLCFLSAHCIPLNKFWLKNLLNYMNNRKIVGAYGRQVPTKETSIFESKELYYTFKKDFIIQKNSSFFHNANSLIKYSFWEKKKFNEKTDHVEDILWANYWIKKKYQIVYQPKAIVSHYHGMQHYQKDIKVKKILKLLKICPI